MTRADCAERRTGTIPRQRAARVVATAPCTPPRLQFPVVRRTRLLDRLSESVRTVPLTVVWAPAGAGKTTLAATWAAHHPPTAVHVTWLRVDDGDSGLAAVRARLTHARHDPAATVLVVDNAERLTDPLVPQLIDDLVRDESCRCRVVLLSRVEPPLPLHRYRLDGSVAELGYDDLAFDEREAADLLRLHDVPASSGSARMLVERTAGWAAGIRIAALTLQHAAEPVPVEEVEACLTPAHNLMADYLVAEVVQPMTAFERRLLRSTCVYADLDGALVDELTGRDDGRHVLLELARRHAFVRRVGPASETFRVHPLLRQVLYAEAVHDAPEAVLAAHRRAARWCLAHGRFARAVHHHVQARDWAQVSELVVERRLGELLVGSEGADVAAQLSRIPDDADAPRLDLARAAAA
ncbi:MAG: hypothetical protein HOQ22_13635, partial [Nocardioidaceae bacterium]|nr:hypothetical protein [Nocardioidaceae bacterium]